MPIPRPHPTSQWPPSGRRPVASAFRIFRWRRAAGRHWVPTGRGRKYDRTACAQHLPLTLTIRGYACGQFSTETGWFGRRLIARWLNPAHRPVMLARPREVVVERPSLLRFKISHDGYLPRFGVTHERRITLAPEGDVLEGEDRLEGHYTGPADAQVANPLPPASLHPRQRDPGRADRDAGPARRRDLARAWRRGSSSSSKKASSSRH